MFEYLSNRIGGTGEQIDHCFLHHASICFLWWTWVDCEHTGRKHHLLLLLLLRDIDNRYLKSEMPDFCMHMLLSHPVREGSSGEEGREECSNKLMMINDGWKHVLIRCSSQTIFAIDDMDIIADGSNERQEQNSPPSSLAATAAALTDTYRVKDGPSPVLPLINNCFCYTRRREK